MEVSHALPPQVAESLARGGIVLTANQRAARTLHRAFDLRQRSLGIACWEPPAILAWDSWLEYLWHRLLLQGDASDLLLSPTQEHTIWRAIIAADTATSSLRPVDALAQTAADAFRLLHDYRARNRLHASLSNSDTRSFDLWANEFDRRCVRSHYLTHAQLAEALRTAVPAGHLTLPIELLLVGFDSKLPTQTALLDAVKSAGTAIDEYAPPPSVPSSTLASAPDDRTELAACAQWLRAHLAERPNATIAVIVPSIEPQRAEIDRVFRNILAPELNDIAAPNNSGPYEFSLGVPLAHTPLVAAALDILRWSIDPLPLDRLCALLLSPYFATNDPESTEFLARAEFDAFVLRQQHLLRP
jgi:ATP-dependent helicase/nuclease subunit B